MKFEVKKINKNLSDEELLADVLRVSIIIQPKKITIDNYNQFGNFHSTTLTRRFGSWFSILEKCNLEQNRSKINISIAELFENLQIVWITLGRQPKYSEMQKPISNISVGTYENRFGSWYKALEAFVSFVNNGDSSELNDVYQNRLQNNSTVRKTKRIPSNRLKVMVLMRDGNRCKLCGIECNDGLHNIHFDHIFPWSKGGETTFENLQILCSACNEAKGSYYPEEK